MRLDCSDRRARSGLAVQCISLGYRAEAVQLSEARANHGRGLPNPRAVSYDNATLVNATAQDDDPSLATAETAIGKQVTGPGDSWAAHYSKYRRLLWARSIAPKIARRGGPHGSGLGKTRWVVERTFAWPHQFKRLRTRYETRAVPTRDSSNSPAPSST